MLEAALSDAHIAIQIVPAHAFVSRSRGLTYEAMKKFGGRFLIRPSTKHYFCYLAA